MEAILFYVGSLQGTACFKTYLNTKGCADQPMLKPEPKASVILHLIVLER